MQGGVARGGAELRSHKEANSGAFSGSFPKEVDAGGRAVDRGRGKGKGPEVGQVSWQSSFSGLQHSRSTTFNKSKMISDYLWPRL